MPGPIFLEGDEVTLRPVEDEDVEFVQRCVNDPCVWRPALDSTPMNHEQGMEFFEDVLSDEGSVHCLACDGEKRLGIVSLTGTEYGPGATDRSRAAEIAYYLAPEHHGQGYGSDAVGEELGEQFREPDARDRTVVASGTSCLEQLDDLLARPTRHPVELVDPGR